MRALTHRDMIRRYAAKHGLSVSGKQSDGLVCVIDKQGHFSESWSLHNTTWTGLYEVLVEIEQDYVVTLSRPWEVARKTYTGTMKPQTKAA